MIQSFQERAPRDIPIKIPRSGFFSWPLKWCGYFCSGVTFLPTIFSWSVKLHTCRITPDLLMFKAQRMIQLFAYCTIWYTIPYNGPMLKQKSLLECPRLGVDIIYWLFLSVLNTTPMFQMISIPFILRNTMAAIRSVSLVRAFLVKHN